jgi:hypothetical protein
MVRPSDEGQVAPAATQTPAADRHGAWAGIRQPPLVRSGCPRGATASSPPRQRLAGADVGAPIVVSRRLCSAGRLRPSEFERRAPTGALRHDAKRPAKGPADARGESSRPLPCLDENGAVLGGHRVISRDENPRARPVPLGEFAEKVGVFVRIDTQLRSRYGISPAIPKLSGQPSRKVSVDNDQTETSPHGPPGS